MGEVAVGRPGAEEVAAVKADYNKAGSFLYDPASYLLDKKFFYEWPLALSTDPALGVTVVALGV